MVLAVVKNHKRVLVSELSMCHAAVTPSLFQTAKRCLRRRWRGCRDETLTDSWPGHAPVRRPRRSHQRSRRSPGSPAFPKSCLQGQGCQMPQRQVIDEKARRRRRPVLAFCSRSAYRLCHPGMPLLHATCRVPVPSTGRSHDNPRLLRRKAWPHPRQKPPVQCFLHSSVPG